MAQVRDPETAYAELGRPSSRDLRRQYSSHHFVPKDQHVISDELEASLRLGFIRKVYGILAAQMLVTVAVSCFCMSTQSIRAVVIVTMANPVVHILTLIPTIAVLFCMHCAKHQYPQNYILLSAFTLLMSLDVGFVCALFYEAGLGKLIVEAFVLTAVIFVGLSAYTLISGKDFSWCKSFLFSCLLILIFVGTVGFFFPGLVDNIVYPLLGTLVFCGYIVFDTYRITKTFGYDDYIIAAIELYLDIINLFLYILQLLAENK